MSALSPEQLEGLQAFLKDWLRHSGRTQADLRRALQASSIRMPVLLEALQHTYAGEGLTGLAGQLCGIEERWQLEDQAIDTVPAPTAQDGSASLGQLDLLLQEIRSERRD
ncbi:hypothetical protein [Cyanobium sp. NS01]|uniref:hypothetical protein n=1 Tax=Cyanobium sp. NS01 TaxID=261284 RepID=UPI00164717F0|nr:hypothetical protein [Cyanobium sp. NS01]QNI70081.1 hypothetical protein CyaNS01_00943 [Cyanobium sp. NS01]